MLENQSFSKAGGDPGWIRTIDLPLRRRPLYPLSYGATRDFNALKSQPWQRKKMKRGGKFWPTTSPLVRRVRFESLRGHARYRQPTLIMEGC